MFGFKYLKPFQWIEYLKEYYRSNILKMKSREKEWFLNNGQTIGIPEHHLGIFREVFMEEVYQLRYKRFSLLNIGANAGIVEAYYNYKRKTFTSTGIEILPEMETYYRWNAKEDSLIIGDATNSNNLEKAINRWNNIEPFSKDKKVAKIDIEGAEYNLPKKELNRILDIADYIMIEVHEPYSKAYELSAHIISKGFEKIKENNPWHYQKVKRK